MSPQQLATTSKRPSRVRMSSTMSVVQDTQRRVHLRYQHRTAVVLLGVCGAAAWAAFHFIPDGPRLLFGFAFGSFALLIGLLSLWREELELDLAAGQWRHRRGWVWSGVKPTRGAITEIPEVELILDRRTSSEDSSPTWQVRIQAPTWHGAITVASSYKEEKGYAQLEKWAKRLRRDAVDRTGDGEIRTAWDALDQSLGRRDAARGRDGVDAVLADSFAPGMSAEPPAGSRIVVTTERGRRRIVLPPMGLNGGVLFMALFGLVFGGFGAVFALVSSTLIPNVRVNGVIPTSPVWPMVIMGAVFALIGLVIMVAPAIGARSREWIEDGPDALVTGYSGFGMTWGVKRLPKHAIESVDLSVSPTAEVGVKQRRRREIGQAADDDPRDLRIRTNERVLRIGRYLSVEELTWLRDRVEMVVLV